MRVVPLPGLDHDGPAGTGLERPDRVPAAAPADRQSAAADDPGPGMAIAPVTPVSGADEHSAERPSWDCRACGRPWPCDPAREHLQSEMDGTVLAVYMWG